MFFFLFFLILPKYESVSLKKRKKKNNFSLSSLTGGLENKNLFKLSVKHVLFSEFGLVSLSEYFCNIFVTSVLF